MDKEVHPTVFAYIEATRLSGLKITATKRIETMGVRDAPGQRYEYAWTDAGDVVIATIWAEFVRVHPATGRWYCIESLDTQHRLGGGEREEGQKERGRRRLALLKKCYDSKRSLRGVLQINRVPIAELERNRSAEVAVRVKDDTEWFVSSGDEDRLRAVLVRGPAGWIPTEADLEQTSMTSGSAVPQATHTASVPVSTAAPPPKSEMTTAAQALDAEGSSPESMPRLAFPDQALRERIEAAAMLHMKREIEGAGLRVDDVSDQNLGYDLEVTDAQGKGVFKIEVKGTSAAAPGYFMTRNERQCSTREATWRLAVVTHALGDPKHTIYTPVEMERLFALDALVWRCDLKR